MKTLGVIRTLVTPNKLTDVKFKDISDKLKKHFCPKANEIFKRFKFHKRVQGKNEPFNSYVAELRKLADGCNFDTTLSNRLRDQIVCGINDEDVQRRLLSESALDLDSAISMALAAESAASQSKLMRSENSFASNSQQSVDLLRHKKAVKGKLQNSKNETGKVCYSCGSNHLRADCKFRNAVCHFCKGKGHIQKVCRKKGSTPSRTNEIGVQEEYVNSLNGHSFKQKIEVQLEGKNLNFEIDSGSYYSIISMSTFKRLFEVKKPIIRKTPVELRDFQQNKILLAGVCKIQVTFKNRKANLELLVSRGRCTNILGCSWFGALGIYLGGINETKSGIINDLLYKYRDVFSEGLGSYLGKPISLPLDPEFPPFDSNPETFPSQ